MRTDGGGDAIGELTKPALARRLAHAFNLDAGQTSASLCGPEVLERDRRPWGPGGKMGAAERRHACGGGKILVHLRYGGIEQQPRLVAHHSAPEGGPCGARVEAIAFDQEFFERSGRRAPPFRAGGEAHFEPAAPEKPLAAVPALAALPPRRKVWQPHREARDGDCERVRRVEAEEPDQIGRASCRERE